MIERFIHIDILRGLCMFSVIYSHILLFCIGYTETSLLTDFLRGFYLNTFFFISGFLSYKANWDFSTTRNFLKKKIATLLIPTRFCLGVFCFFMRINYMTSLLDANKSGYWFTFTLFEMFSLYAIHSYITNTIKNKKYQTSLLILLALGSYLLNKVHIITSPLWGGIFNIGGLLYYIPLFWIGIACRINIDLFHKIINLKVVRICLFIIVILGLKSNFIPLIIYSISSTLFIYTIINNFTANKYYGKVQKYGYNILKTIGENSLQIYFLHYFLLFRYPESTINYMHGLYSDYCFATHSCAGFIEFCIVGITSILISFTCIYIAKVLNYIPYIGIFMLGYTAK